MTEEELNDRIEDFKEEALGRVPLFCEKARERINNAETLEQISQGISAFLEEMRPKGDWRDDSQYRAQAGSYRVYEKNLLPIRNTVDDLAKDLVIVAEEREM